MITKIDIKDLPENVSKVYICNHNFKKYSFENAIVLALNAGVDILLFSKEYYEDKPVLDEVIRIVRENIKNGNIKRQTIDEAYIRVKNLKSKFIN